METDREGRPPGLPLFWSCFFLFPFSCRYRVRHKSGFNRKLACSLDNIDRIGFYMVSIDAACKFTVDKSMKHVFSEFKRQED